MRHPAILKGTGNGDGTTWLEPVTDDDQYPPQNSDRCEKLRCSP
jgi:hypothetical protein